jgi:histidinol-phosphate aminotransferase
MAGWRDNIRRVVPYVPGEQPKVQNVIKLNTNENPYGPSPRVNGIKENMNDLRLYPDPAASDLINELAAYHGVEPSQVFVGVGSDDVLAMSFLTFFNSDKPILFPDITYSFYDVWADLFRIPYERPALDEAFRLVKEDYYRENGGIVFPNPNAPTGIYEDLSNVEDIIKHNQDSIVIVDEAYIDFGGESALSLIDKYENLVVVRTFSKSRSMAGLRIGYAISNTELIKALNDVKYSYNSYTMNRPSILLGVESIKDDEYFKSTVAKVTATRERFVKNIYELGFTCLPSSANFVFATHNSIPAKDIFEAAKANNIFVRYFDKPRINNYLRITIGTDEEMDRFVEFLGEYVKRV